METADLRKLSAVATGVLIIIALFSVAETLTEQPPIRRLVLKPLHAPIPLREELAEEVFCVGLARVLVRPSAQKEQRAQEKDQG